MISIANNDISISYILLPLFLYLATSAAVLLLMLLVLLPLLLKLLLLLLLLLLLVLKLLLYMMLLRLLYNIHRVPGFEPEILRPQTCFAKKFAHCRISASEIKNDLQQLLVGLATSIGK